LKTLEDGLILQSQATLFRSRAAALDEGGRATLGALLRRLSAD